MIIDAEECACKGHNLAKGHQNGRMYLTRRRHAKSGNKQRRPKAYHAYRTSELSFPRAGTFTIIHNYSFFKQGMSRPGEFVSGRLKD